MDEHRLREERSLALHAAVADKLRAHPELLAGARQRVETWLEPRGAASHLLLQWREILDRPLEDILVVLTDRSERAAWLRKASPFAGALEPRERERILRSVREALEAQG